MNTLLEEFNTYLEGRIENISLNELSPTITLPLINKNSIEFEENDLLKRINPDIDDSVEVTNEILKNLNLEKNNISTLKFIFHELIANIYDHSKFNRAFVMGKFIDNYYEFSFIDNGISIPKSLENNNYSFKNDCETVLKALNGLSTKNNFGYIERGTGLNNTANIVINGSEGSILIVSGCALIFLRENEIFKKELKDKCINGTLISIRMNLNKKIDIYNYLHQEKFG